MPACMGPLLRFLALSGPSIGLCAGDKIKNPYLYTAYILGGKTDNTKVRKEINKTIRDW